ncbi:MAG: tetratricopeptide repeat protein [Bryobacteraceae bacterium]
MTRSGCVLLLAVSGLQAELGYVDPAKCRMCHQEIFDRYAKTAMARSLYRAEAAGTLAQSKTSLFHALSGRRFAVYRSNGEIYVRRELAAGDGAIEKRVDYIIGSGNHARSLVHRKENGRLLELPVSWYAEGGGHWAMSPGYDRADHSDFRREVPDACLFCHNGYPREGRLPEGIDCQRCHGPGEAHASRGAPIVNPARLTPPRRLEVCMQCHLETSGRSIPDAIRRYDRTPFAYRPGEPLGAFLLYFDRADGIRDEPFTVNGSARGLRESKCFQNSGERLLCTTCHDPHQGGTRPAQVCQGCHQTAHRGENRDACFDCHMPKRRTDDAVHVVMTDHQIRRRPMPGDLLAPKRERHDRYSGPVKLAYPITPPDAASGRLYLAVAAASAQPQAVRRLEEELQKAKPAQAQFFVEAAQAWRRLGRAGDALRNLEAAIERDRAHAAARIALAEVRIEMGQADRAALELEQAIRLLPADANLLVALAVAYSRLSRFQEALPVLEKSLRLEPDSPLAHLNRGVCLQALGDREGARAAYNTALRLQPDLERARAYLRSLK